MSYFKALLQSDDLALPQHVIKVVTSVCLQRLLTQMGKCAFFTFLNAQAHKITHITRSNNADQSN